MSFAVALIATGFITLVAPNKLICVGRVESSMSTTPEKPYLLFSKSRLVIAPPGQTPNNFPLIGV